MTDRRLPHAFFRSGLKTSALLQDAALALGSSCALGLMNGQSSKWKKPHACGRSCNSGVSAYGPHVATTLGFMAKYSRRVCSSFPSRRAYKDMASQNTRRLRRCAAASLANSGLRRARQAICSSFTPSSQILPDSRKRSTSWSVPPWLSSFQSNSPSLRGTVGTGRANTCRGWFEVELASSSPREEEAVTGNCRAVAPSAKAYGK
mmetsp:Transcript_13213/g.23525  ORF Transcript_13213/g.23525 Transcript_13213/m.23525 type:complete len:205 (-) Transcript_13213:673-1287(-)